jgi:two-component system, LuxR family, response regulator FixJ
LAIFVVDDDPGALSSLRFLLETEGYTVVSFRNGLDLLGIFPGPDPSCVVIDYKMPHMNGLDVFFQLRELHVDVPVILVTGHPDPGIRRRARTAGVELIEKPLSQDILLAAIRNSQLAKAENQREAT